RHGVCPHLYYMPKKRRTPVLPTETTTPSRAAPMEQTMIGLSAGLAMEGMIPVVHTDAPFLVERPFEQIKADFCYQNLAGNFVSTGASYDYAFEGMSHQGPADVPLLRVLPGMQVVVPGTGAEFDLLFRESYANGHSTYYRTQLSDNSETHPVRFGSLSLIRRGSRATVVAVGPVLSSVLSAVEGLDVTVLYCTTVAPFDVDTLCDLCTGGDIVLVEPYYDATLVPDIVAAMRHRLIRIEAIGVPHVLLSNYGTPEDHTRNIGLTPAGIRSRVDAFLALG